MHNFHCGKESTTPLELRGSTVQPTFEFGVVGFGKLQKPYKEQAIYVDPRGANGSGCRVLLVKRNRRSSSRSSSGSSSHSRPTGSSRSSSSTTEAPVTRPCFLL